MNKPQIIFREATTADELHELFCLRKRVLLNSRISAVAQHNTAELDLECYDRFANHMGLYLISGGESRAIGYQRGVIERLGPACRAVEGLASAYPDQESELFRQRPVPFPCLAYLPFPKGVEDTCDTYREAGAQIVESTRFAVDESVRSLRLALFFVKCVIARYMFNDYIGFGLTAVKSSSKKSYLQMGFTQPAGFHDRYIPFLDLEAAPLCIDPELVSQDLAQLYRELASEYNSNGCICADETVVNKVLSRKSAIRKVA